MPTTDTLTIDVHLTPDDLHAALARDARVGLTADPRSLPPKWFYDDRGSELFDQITRLAEYYPTEAERHILVERSDEIAALANAETLVELGSGTSDKTRLLLDACCRRHLQRFVPFDVSEGILRYAAAVIAERHPELEVHGVVGDFDLHLGALPAGGPRLVAFLGGTIGNLTPPQRARFLSRLGVELVSGEALLLGSDLVKDPQRLLRAYDDAAGITAAFNRNVLSVLNNELDGDFDLTAFEHEARWDRDEQWIEMWLRSTLDQRVRLREVGMKIDFEAGDAVRTEISAKFTREGLTAELNAAGFDVAGWWTDPAGDFALSLSFRR